MRASLITPPPCRWNSDSEIYSQPYVKSRSTISHQGIIVAKHIALRSIHFLNLKKLLQAYCVDRVNVILEQWAKRAALARAAHLAHFSISVATSTL